MWFEWIYLFGRHVGSNAKDTPLMQSFLHACPPISPLFSKEKMIDL
jgi:hypothetical protein